VLRHRVAIAPELAISGQTVDQVLETIIRSTEAPRR
jgi:MoxR-like ATPase